MMTDTPTVQIKTLRGPNPFVAYYGDAGLDLSFNPADNKAVVIRPGDMLMVQTGVMVAIPEGYAGLILPRSGMASKRGLRPRNSPGLIDPGYRGEVLVPLENCSKDREYVQAGERIAQLVIVPILSPSSFLLVEELDNDTERGEGGFGSSDDGDFGSSD